jgi:SAM-dependent methyltransferase
VSRQPALPSLVSTTERDPLNFNRTPAWVVQLVVPLLGLPQTVLDVGCGDGAIGRVLRQAWPGVQLHGVEVHPVRAKECAGTYTVTEVCDWLSALYDVGYPRWADLIISNPPFGLAALDFLKRAVERAAPDGTVAFLLPTHWDHDPDVEAAREVAPSGERYEPFARQRFLDSLRTPDGREGYARFPIVGGGPNPARPSFKMKGTASDRYAWFLFGEQWAGQPGRRLHAIPPEEPSAQLTLVK